MDIKTLFPLKGTITQQIIEGAKRTSPEFCVGALTLKAALAGKADLDSIKWINTIGFYDRDIVITTQEQVKMITVREPQEVTFILKEEI